MPVVGNFFAWIQIDGRKLTEYGVEISADGAQATCWIPSETGKTFAICVHDSERVYPTLTTVYVDGTRCNGKVLHRKSERPRSSSTSIQSGVAVSDGAYKPFIFSNCKLVEDDEDKPFSEMIAASDVGNIKVVVDEVKLRGLKSGGYAPCEFPPLRFSERDKKGIVHGIQLGEDVCKKVKQRRKTHKIRQVATFVFRYRPLAVLQADGRVPSIVRDSDNQPARSNTNPKFVVKEEEQSKDNINVEVKEEPLGVILKKAWATLEQCKRHESLTYAAGPCPQVNYKLGRYSPC